MCEINSKRLNTPISENLKSAVEAKAASLGVSTSAYVRMVLSKSLKQ